MVELARRHCLIPLIAQDELDKSEPFILSSGAGCTVKDINGNTYLDAMSSQSRANSLGYANEEVAAAIFEQASKLHYVGSQVLSAPTIDLAAKIAEKAPNGLSKSLFFSGGSEAVEGALKLAKQYQQNNGKPHAYKTISRWNSYHGSTMGALSVTDWLAVREVFDPRVPGHSFIPNPTCYRNHFGMPQDEYIDLCARSLERQIQLEGPDNVAAFIAEPIQQANGVQIAPASYWRTVREICDRYDVLLIVDEIITGFGRTGKWFGSENFDIKPDIVTCAKALSAGYLPLGAVITTDAIASGIPMYRHVQTFNGHATACAAALAAIAIKERLGLIDVALENGKYIQSTLRAALGEHPNVGDIRGIGHWHAVDFTSDRTTRAPLENGFVRNIAVVARELGVLLNSNGTAIEIAPALIASKEELDQIIQALVKSIDTVKKRSM